MTYMYELNEKGGRQQPFKTRVIMTEPYIPTNLEAMKDHAIKTSEVIKVSTPQGSGLPGHNLKSKPWNYWKVLESRKSQFFKDEASSNQKEKLKRVVVM